MNKNEPNSEAWHGNLKGKSLVHYILEKIGATIVQNPQFELEAEQTIRKIAEQAGIEWPDDNEEVGIDRMNALCSATRKYDIVDKKTKTFKFIDDFNYGPSKQPYYGIHIDRDNGHIIFQRVVWKKSMGERIYIYEKDMSSISSPEPKILITENRRSYKKGEKSSKQEVEVKTVCNSEGIAIKLRRVNTDGTEIMYRRDEKIPTVIEKAEKGKPKKYIVGDPKNLQNLTPELEETIDRNTGEITEQVIGKTFDTRSDALREFQRRKGEFSSAISDLNAQTLGVTQKRIRDGILKLAEKAGINIETPTGERVK